jgi:deazaflavin-dependent oxidoreductase (nitroreductase family)
LKRTVETFFQKHLVNPRVLRQAGEPGAGAIVETTGRRTGLPRRVPVLGGLVGDTLWIAAHHGRSAAWVKNVEANPRVRVKVAGFWRTGLATLMPDDDPLERVGSIDSRFAQQAKRMGTELMAVRVDLDPAEGDRSSVVRAEDP